MGAVRRCVGCRQSDTKDQLLRVVHQGGRAVVDESATRPGRGGYVHRNRECVDASRRSGVWSRALKVSPLDLEDLNRLVAGWDDDQRVRLNG